jgi:tRNA(Ile)-lysidine synthase
VSGAADRRHATGPVPEQVLEKVLDTIKRHRMIAPGDLLIVAVSGGPDSMCLLHVLNSLRGELGFSAHVAHLNHHMREQAPRDAAMVEEVAVRLEIPCTIGHAEVHEIAKELGIGVEEAGRKARYDFFRRLKASLTATPEVSSAQSPRRDEGTECEPGAAKNTPWRSDSRPSRAPDTVKIALGHNLNDQAETVFMRLMRGSGTRGLAGIPPVNGDIIRPLLDVSRDAIEDYCRKQGLTTITDVYNLDLQYTRNRIRYEALPALAESFNPSLIQTLATTASVLRWDTDYFNDHAEAAFKQISNKEGRVTSVSEKLLGTMPTAISSRVLEKAWQECARSTASLALSHVRDLIVGAGAAGLSSVSLPGGVAVHRHAGFLRFSPVAVEVDIPLPSLGDDRGRGNSHKDSGERSGGLTDGENDPIAARHPEVAIPVPELGITLILRLVEGNEAERAKSMAMRGQVESPVYTPGYDLYLEPIVYMDYNEIGGSLRLRTWKCGDRFSPLGMNGKSQKLQDFFVTRRLPRFYRGLVPLLTDDSDIIWVGGLRLSEKCRLNRDSLRLVRAEIRPDLRRSGCCATL